MCGSHLHQYRHTCQRGLQLFVIPGPEHPPEATHLSLRMILDLEAGHWVVHIRIHAVICRACLQTSKLVLQCRSELPARSTKRRADRAGAGLWLGLHEPLHGRQISQEQDHCSFQFKDTESTDRQPSKRERPQESGEALSPFLCCNPRLE